MTWLYCAARTQLRIGESNTNLLVNSPEIPRFFKGVATLSELNAQPANNKPKNRNEKSSEIQWNSFAHISSERSRKFRDSMCVFFGWSDDIIAIEV
jgi:hypothetical protein